MSRMTGIADGRRVAVVVDGSRASGEALQRGASQARQRNALLDVVSILPGDADTRARITARVRLSEFIREQCPYGVGAPVRLRVECGDPQALLPLIEAGAELVLSEDLEAPAAPGAEPGGSAAADRRQRAPHRWRWWLFLMHDAQA